MSGLGCIYNTYTKVGSLAAHALLELFMLILLKCNTNSWRVFTSLSTTIGRWCCCTFLLFLSVADCKQDVLDVRMAYIAACEGLFSSWGLERPSISHTCSCLRLESWMSMRQTIVTMLQSEEALLVSVSTDSHVVVRSTLSTEDPSFSPVNSVLIGWA